ncbi:ABC transporter ATP-binding protein [Clostridium sp. E02]|uniref:ABC transporter ATP-binding protein n=1 Tax=Clostridium sp. E02 TaxID=2487134 RepID=UPI000F54394A|nr:ABC transporter ATP-binding protein [Clostridium sp. E02]
MAKLTDYSLRLEIFKEIYPYLKGNKRYLAALFCMKAWTLILSLLPPWLYLILVNYVMVEHRKQYLLWIVLGYIAVYLLQTVDTVFQKVVGNILYFRLEVRLKKKMIQNLTRIPQEDFEKYGIGSLKTKLESDTGSIRRFLQEHILNFYHSLISSIVIAVILLNMSLQLALVGFLMVPISYLFTKVMGKRIQKVASEQREEKGNYESFLHGILQNWKEVKTNNLQADCIRTLQKHRRLQTEQFRRAQIYWYINRGFISIKEFFITKLNLYFCGGILSFLGYINIGIMLAFMNYYEQFFKLINQCCDSVLNLKSDVPLIQHVLELYSINTEQKTRVRNLESEIRLEYVNFCYSGSKGNVLKDINLCIHSGEHVAVIGRSGCGKTTLAKVIMGLYQLQSGKVFLGGYDVACISRESIGKKVSIVTQDTQMFNLSIRENLRFAKWNATDEELFHACKEACIYNFILSLPMGLETIVGERGVKLSGGQKQRLAIARVFLKNTDILIFDEATSSLDGQNETLVMEAVRKISSGKTLITIAHRLSSIQNCGRIIVMDGSCISAVGTHKELFDTNPTYRSIFSRQIKIEKNSKGGILL